MMTLQWNTWVASHSNLAKAVCTTAAGLDMAALQSHTGQPWQTVLTCTSLAGVVEGSEGHNDLDAHPHPNGDQAAGADARHDLLKVGNIVGAGDEGSCAAKEGVGPCGIHDGMLLALLDAGAGEANVA